MADYPITDGGVPLLVPFFPTPRFYHNNSSWPFVDKFFLRAWEKTYRVDRTALNAALLARTCRPDGMFREVVHFRSKKPQGSRNQLWTAASFIDVCKRASILEKIPRK
jgi:glycogen debranching enzyme